MADVGSITVKQETRPCLVRGRWIGDKWSLTSSGDVWRGALFHGFQWGCKDPVAIVEYSDGAADAVWVKLIRFMDTVKFIYPEDKPCEEEALT